MLLVFSVISVVPVGSWHTPCSTDDELYEEFGPRPSQLLIKVYTDYVAELEGFKNQEVDIMDWALEPLDYQWFQTNDPNHEQYSTAFYNEFEIFQYDFNCQVMPTMLVSVRQALAHIVDKQYFIDTNLNGMGKKIDSALGNLPGWYNPACTNKYNLQQRTTMTPLPDDPLDWEAAYDLLVAELGPPIQDPEDPAYFTWTWPTPFPDPDPTGTFPPVPDGYLLFHARSDSAIRMVQGNYFKDCVYTFMPQILSSLGKPPARIHVQLWIVPRSIYNGQVRAYYRYHLSTGGWILNTPDPDFLLFYTTNFIQKPDPYGYNYVMYSNPDYDIEVDLMITASSIGTADNPCDAVYHAWQAQEIMENDEPVIWMWSTAGYKAYLSNWEGIVNEVGFGANSWWTFMNAHKAGSESCDTIRYGWAGDLFSLNIISANWYSDFEVLNKVYDTSINYNPYGTAEDRPSIVAGWEYDTWEPTPGYTCTKLTLHIRQDVWWQDVPAHDRTTIAWDGGTQLNGPFINYQLTPVDVAFSSIYQASNPNSWWGWCIADVDHVCINLDDCWGDMWPWTYPGADPHWWDLDDTPDPYSFPYTYVQHEDIGAYDIGFYFNWYAPWLTLHMIGQLPIIPHHVWSEILISNSHTIDPWIYDICYGTGPYILLSRTPGVEMTMIPFRTGQTYRGVTLAHSYYALPVRPTETDPYGVEVVQYGVPAQQDIVSGIIFRANFHGYDRISAHDIEFYFTYGLRWEGGSYNGTSPTFVSPPIPFCTTWTAEWLLRWRDVTPPIPVCAVVKVHVDLHWHIASCWEYNPITQEYDIPHPGCNFISLWGHLDEGVPTCPNWYTFTVYRGIERCIYSFPADINGDGIVDIGDGSQVGLYWMRIY